MNEKEVKEIRNKLGLTQVEFAKRLGVDTKTVQNWESGKRIPVSKHGILRALVPTIKEQTFYGGEQSNVNGDNVMGNNVTITKTDTAKLLDLLQAKEQSLAKAQEHIDKLLGIIDKMTSN